jgi:hypothetical protein
METKIIKGKNYFKREDVWLYTDKNGVEKKVGSEKLLAQLEDDNSIKGLGDIIAKFTKAFGIKECEACKMRRDYLNVRFSAIKLDKSKLTVEDIELVMKAEQSKSLKTDEVKKIFEVYNRLFNMKVKPCNCPSIIATMIEKLVFKISEVK